MKKNLFVVATVALIAAVSCNKESEQIPTGNVVTFEASVDGVDSKVALDGKVSKWENGDKITIHNGTEGYEFSTTDAGAKANFTYAGNGFAGEKFMAVYPAGTYTADVEAKTVSDVVIPDKQVLVAGSFPKASAYAVAYSETASLEFKNVVALLKFKVTGDDVTYGCFYGNNGSGNITGKYSVEYNDGDPVLKAVEATQWVDFHMNDAVLSEDATYYLAVAPAVFENGFAFSLNGAVVKTYDGKFTLERNCIYDLGIIEYKNADPSSLSWGICGDMTSWGGVEDIPMTLDGDWFVAENVAVGAEQYFKLRADGSWTVNRGAEGDAKVTLTPGASVNVWHNGQDMTVAAGNYNFYLSKDCATFKVETVGGSDTPEVTPGEACPWSVAGTFNSWGDTDMVTTTVSNVFVAENVKLDAYASLKVRKDHLWNESYGGGIVYLIPNHWMTVYNNGSDISVTEAGTYDIYFDYTNKRLYVVADGTDYTSVSQQTTEGPEPKQEEPEVTEKVVYLKPNANWKQSNARFAIYVWGGTAGEKWVSMTSVGNGIYEAHLPEGYDYGCNIIFCRMNPSGSANNWNNKWNQTSDLKTPTDGKNLYTVNEGTWDKGGGAWSVKE